MLRNMAEFAGLGGQELLHFLTPGRKHLEQGLFEFNDEFASVYSDSSLKMSREVLP